MYSVIVVVVIVWIILTMHLVYERRDVVGILHALLTGVVFYLFYLLDTAKL